MKNFVSFIAILFLITLVTTSYAGPTTNRDEYKGDELLTSDQQAEFQKKLDQGLRYFDNGEYDLAEKEFKSILTFAPKKNLAYFNLGLVKYRQGDYQAAIDNFDQVIKHKSYYVGAAFYYKAISQLNLDQKDEAVKTAKRFTQAHFFFAPSQNLIRSIESGSDEYLENAQAAFADKNYELCLVEMEESVLSETQKGKSLVQQCRTALFAETAAPAQNLPVAGNTHKLYFEARVGHTDNAYQENADILGKYLYSVTVGGEYIVKNKVDYGLGVSYDYANAMDLANFKDELYNVYVPLFYRVNKNRFSAELYYNQSKNNGDDAYSETGAFFSYLYVGEKYLLGFIGNVSDKTSLSSAFDYRKGSYSSTRLIVTRYFDALTLAASLAFEENLSGDQHVGTATLPFANTALRYGLSAAYDLTMKAKITLRGNFTDRNYIHVVSANGTDRDDSTSNYSLTYQYSFNPYLKGFLQQSYVMNDSNYNANEIINENYTENVTTLGVSVVSF